MESFNIYNYGKNTNRNSIPEVSRDQPYSNPSDTYSLECVIYEMATLKPSFRANDLKGLFRKMSAGIYENYPNSILKNKFHDCFSLKVPSQLRPNYEQILNDSTIKKYIDKFEPQSKQQQQLAKAQLLQTILLPKNLKQLQIKLATPMYDIKQPIKQLPNQPKSTRSVSFNKQKYTVRSKIILLNVKKNNQMLFLISKYQDLKYPQLLPNNSNL
ncbi:unnamed protein product [Paramecium primaurelia]|uniref:non-specific serine/threonine protein kinase n=1 Tax=Paramecium primaurelia TaxID=5886 RepID=A0A8S1LGR1_PARPR|nr:unnamed protein product [Paramecium primaurelia]